MDSSDFTEFRWGNRFEMNLPADLWLTDGTCAPAIVRNASVSGALVETDIRPPLMTHVSLRSRDRSGTPLDAWVVRTDPKGIALEWLDPGTGKSTSALLSARFGSK